MQFSIQGNVVNIFDRVIFYGEVTVEDGKISAISKISAAKEDAGFILPGFVDSHVHIESSMLVPSEFARMAVVHGTVATVSDPHEIANVCGMAGVEFMIENGKTVPFKFNFGAPSCVPATIFETAGAALNSADVESLLQKDDVKYLSEMMNFPGVLNGDEEVMKKIAAAKKYNKPVDGHAPGLRGEAAKIYIAAGITTDHECFTAEEALDKLQYGMQILIREGSAAKNFEALVDLLRDHASRMMFCSDDKHPDSLDEGHINLLCERAVAKGIDVFNVLQAACINPVLHYKLNVGLLREGDAADFIVAEDLSHFKIKQTYIDGLLVASDGVSLITAHTSGLINQFDCVEKKIADFTMADTGSKEIFVIEAMEGQLITNKLSMQPSVANGAIVSNVANDILKIVVVNRYKNAPVAKSFVKNFGLKQGAIASSVAHDSHNIIAVGVDDESMCRAVNMVIKEKGGISAVSDNGPDMVLGLPVAGLMSNEDGYTVAARYTAIDKMVKEKLGSTLAAPFMTLSFMALLVIPHLKLSDLGLFDGDQFAFID
ncbi:adenine deaminase [Ferruginibacter paludis]|uniref:adenine deaminase n=1 Tax=Ferruginibacter paludis TaxID=1310417 RepID=UPI0025B29898|nr:adenine deaminase [Ferruginibacter paludis]MDN3658795.1 adenine deaminase [Ferruginibacter paludis]